jgi:hypothetical protein
LAGALQALGEREPGSRPLEAAIAAYRASLDVRARDRAPNEVALTRVNLGTALWTLGEREKDPTRLEEALATLRTALVGFQRIGADFHAGMTRRRIQTLEGVIAALKP